VMVSNYPASMTPGVTAKGEHAFGRHGRDILCPMISLVRKGGAHPTVA